jgi:putative hydrolase of the HAD superfamily
MPLPRALLFDLDGTLRHSHPNGEEVFGQFVAELGLPFSAAQDQTVRRWAHFYWSIAPELVQDIRELGFDSRPFWARYTERRLAAVGIEGDVPALAEAIVQRYESHYQPKDHIPADVIPTLTTLLERGFVLGLVSNRAQPLDDYAHELGLAAYFRFTLAAGQINSWKPDPAIFHTAVALAGCAAQEAWYIGDNFYADVEGARNAGLTPVLIDPAGLFPDPGCPVIHTLSELLPLLTAH